MLSVIDNLSEIVLFTYLTYKCQAWLVQYRSCISTGKVYLTAYIISHDIIGHCNPSVRIIDLISHISLSYVVRVNFIHKLRDLQFKVDSEWQIFWETFHSDFIYSQSFCQKSTERKSSKEKFLYFVLMPGLRSETWLYV